MQHIERALHEDIAQLYAPTTQEYLRDPGAALAPARGKCPVFHAPDKNVYVTTTYEDAVDVLGDWETYSSHLLRPLMTPERLRGKLPENPVANSLLNADPPLHTEIRKKTYTAFRPKRIRELEPSIRQIASDQLSSFNGGAGDLMQQFCYPLMWQVVPLHLGLPADDWEQFSDWKNTLVALLALGRKPDVTAEELDPLFDSLAEAWAYFGAHVEERRSNPNGDFASEMVTATDGNPAFSDDRLIYHIFEAMSAGVTTTANLIAALLISLDSHPKQKHEIMQDHGLLPNAIEETLRRHPTATQVMRKVTRDVELNGTTIPEGSLIAVSTAAGNTDEVKFDDPFTFDIHRENANQHLAFGRGNHACAGAPLARLTARIAVEEVYARYPELSITEDAYDFRPIINHWWLDSVAVDWGRPEPA